MVSKTHGGGPGRGGPGGSPSGTSRRRGGKPTTIDLSASEVKRRAEAEPAADEPTVADAPRTTSETSTERTDATQPEATSAAPSRAEVEAGADEPIPHEDAPRPDETADDPDQIFVGRDANVGESDDAAQRSEESTGIPPQDVQPGADPEALAEKPADDNAARPADAQETGPLPLDTADELVRTPDPADATDSAGTTGDRSKEADAAAPVPKPEPRRTSGLGALAAALVGGLVVLAGGAGLVATGLVDLGGDRAPAATPAEVAALTERLDRLAEAVATVPAEPDAELNARVDQLQEALQALPAAGEGGGTAEELASVRAAVDDLAARLETLAAGAGQEGAAVTGQVQELAAALEGLRADAAAREDRIAEATAALERMSAAPSIDPARIDEIAAQLQTTTASVEEIRAAVSGLDNRIAGLQETVGTLSDRVAGNAEALDAAGRRIDDVVARLDAGPTGGEIAALSLAVTSLATSLARGEPFAAELEVVRAAAPDLPGLDRLAPAAAEGIPTVERLADTLPANEILAARRPVEPDAGIVDQLVSGAKSLVNYRTTGEATGDPVMAALAGLESALERGDLSAAAEAAAALPENARQVAPGWFAALDRRIAADEAVDALTQRVLDRLQAPAEGR